MNSAYPETRSQKKFLAGLSLYLFYAALLTLNPFTFSPASLQHWLQQPFSGKAASLLVFHIDDFLLNILMFLPLGLLLAGRLRKKYAARTGAVVLAGILRGAALSFTIEFLQLFLASRSTSLADLLANSLGCGLGVLLALKLSGGAPEKRSQLVPALGWLFAAGIYLVITMLPYQLNSTLNWDDSFTLSVGDEPGGGRPWKGEIALAGIYNRALSAEEARSLCGLGFDLPRVPQRLALGSSALFHFAAAADSFPDLSGLTSLVLRPGAAGPVSADTAAIALTRGELLRSRKPAIGIINAVRQTHQLSVEVWIRSRNTAQTGPARIITMSDGADQRNFTLGQVHDRLHFRVRTPLTGPNGSRIALAAGPVTANDGFSHIIAVFNRGVTRIYQNGAALPQTLYALSDYLPLIFGYGENRIAAFLFLAGLFLPVPLVLMCISRSTVKTLPVSLLLICGVQLFYIGLCGQPPDLFHAAASLAALAAAAAAGSVLKTKKTQPAH